MDTCAMVNILDSGVIFRMDGILRVGIFIRALRKVLMEKSSFWIPVLLWLTR